nr:Uncharacterised protein [Raoultella sp. NCTC 9187]
MQADAETNLTAVTGSLFAHLGDFFRHLRRRLSPGQIEIDLLGGEILRHFRGSAEVERGTRLLQRREHQFRTAHALVLAVEGDGFALHQPAPDMGKFRRGFIALGMIEEYAVAGEFLRIAPGHQVKQRPPLESRSSVAAWRAATVGDTTLGRRATRNFRR